MRDGHHPTGDAPGRRPRVRRAAVLALLAVVPVALAGCHDEERLRERLQGPPTRLPVEPNQPDTPPAPALLDTIEPWKAPTNFPPAVTNSWAIVSAEGLEQVTYRVPAGWEPVEGTGRARNLAGDITARARPTELVDSEISLATYAAQLAETSPIFQYTTEDGHIVYVTRREVALAPSDPDALREVFHTAVLSVDGRILKLDVRYDPSVDWRFDDLADAIVGSIQVRATEGD